MKFVIIFAVLIAVASSQFIDTFDDNNFPDVYGEIQENTVAIDNSPALEEDDDEDLGELDEIDGFEMDLEVNVHKVNKCKLCKRLAKWAKRALHLKPSQLKRAAHMFCKGIRVPGCHQMVDVSIDVLVRLIRAGKSAAEACKLTHHC